jgi:hypothetical protein
MRFPSKGLLAFREGRDPLLASVFIRADWLSSGTLAVRQLDLYIPISETDAFESQIEREATCARLAGSESDCMADH